ncbi:hypothetical protein SERLA73DRAFT_113478 [Serpula lacrymans var. lacrymans S7.3]|uniref:ABC transporter domain-containing protein n=1 Tax=Serpula lacrymans var. lacrymans (strain S7.3) TaxID=936435 RepID=F8Q886_SERL3|nr:hypothetical protein SERLA73DRAFT_113478 [Serpula lacrymans var. lacrymans S7.3]
MLQPWYWDFLTSITIDLPLVAYVLTLPSHITPSALTSIALLHQATKALSLSVGELGIDCTSLNQVFARAKWLYDGLEQNGGMLNGTADYPCAVKTSTRGMRISFRGVTLKYPDSPKDAVHDVSFDIIPGSLVVVVGVNGSGKSSMLKLLARLFDPSSGEILIDDEPLASYDMEQVRATITFLSQSPFIYPLSVKDNICYGLGSDVVLTKAQLDTAARLGGSYDWIHKLQDGYDSIIDPWTSIGNGIDGGTYGPVSERLKRELKSHTTQRADSRLVVLDEATSSLDPIAERDLLSAFLNLREGKTMIFVTHRFEHLVKNADQILCMNDGVIVGSGTHTTLMKNCGEYAGLYNARVSQ